MMDFGARESLPCIVCRVPQDRVDVGSYVLQPNDAMHFSSPGGYGTTAFDPMDGSTLDIVVCDRCITEAAKAGRVFLNQPVIPLKDQIDGAYVGYYSPDREPVEWDPTKTYSRQEAHSVSDEEIVTGNIPCFAFIKAEAIKNARARLENGDPDE